MSDVTTGSLLKKIRTLGDEGRSRAACQRDEVYLPLHALKPRFRGYGTPTQLPPTMVFPSIANK